MSENAIVGKEKFSMYGFSVEVLDNCRVEVNPKSSREKGDVVFQSPKGNRFFVSWGNLNEATKRFSSLEQQRDKSIDRIRKGQDVREVKIEHSSEEKILGHRALMTHVTAEIKLGMFGRATYDRDMWSLHMYCEPRGKYYVVYCLLKDPTEFEDSGKVFKSFTDSFVCH
jgi:hypothetical protein